MADEIQSNVTVGTSTTTTITTTATTVNTSVTTTNVESTDTVALQNAVKSSLEKSDGLTNEPDNSLEFLSGRGVIEMNSDLSVRRQRPVDLYFPSSMDSVVQSTVRPNTFEWQRRRPSWLAATDCYNIESRSRRHRRQQRTTIGFMSSGGSVMDDLNGLTLGSPYSIDEDITTGRIIPSNALSTLSLDAGDLEAARMRRANYWRYH